METLIATAEHHDVYNEWENEDLLNESGEPTNFKQTDFKLEYEKKLAKLVESRWG